MPESAAAPIMVDMQERYPVSVQGVELIADRPGRRDARVLQDGRELSRDVWGKYHFTGADGQDHRLELTQSYSHAGPAVRVDDALDVIPLVRLPRWARRVWILSSVLSFTAILFHGFLLVWASLGVLYLIRRPPRSTRQYVLAAALEVVAVAGQVALFILF